MPIDTDQLDQSQDKNHDFQLYEMRFMGSLPSMGYAPLLKDKPEATTEDNKKLRAEWEILDKALWLDMMASNRGKAWDTIMIQLKTAESGTQAFKKLIERYKPAQLTDSMLILTSLLSTSYKQNADPQEMFNEINSSVTRLVDMDILVSKNADQFSAALSLHVLRQHPEYSGILDALMVHGTPTWPDIQSKIQDKYKMEQAIAERATSDNVLKAISK